MDNFDAADFSLKAFLAILVMVLVLIFWQHATDPDRWVTGMITDKAYDGPGTSNFCSSTPAQWNVIIRADNGDTGVVTLGSGTEWAKWHVGDKVMVNDQKVNGMSDFKTVSDFKTGKDD